MSSTHSRGAMKNNISIFSLGIFLLIALAACNGPIGSATSTPAAAGAGKPLCNPAGLMAPILISPTQQEINPVYGAEVITEVHYPDAECSPQQFEKLVGTDPSFAGPNFIINPGPVNILGGPGEFSGSGQLTTTLVDCTQYFWKARALVGATAGPYSETRTFFTNFSGACDIPPILKTICEPDALIAPEIIQPLNNEVNPIYGAEVITHVEYQDATCTPEYFEKYVSISPAFAGPNLISNPGPVNIFEDFFGSGQLTTTLADCTQYYFRARAVVGLTQGPSSNTHTFFTDFNGTCDLPEAFILDPYVIADVDANCRGGDTTAHDNLGTLFQGQRAIVLGVNRAATYVRIEEPQTHELCWVWLDLVDLIQGDGLLDPNALLDLVDIFTIPPVPTPTFTPEPAFDTEATEVFVPACADGIDNDQDRYTDYLYDPECISQLDNDEAN